MTKTKSDWTVSKRVCEEKDGGEECRLLKEGLEGKEEMRQLLEEEIGTRYNFSLYFFKMKKYKHICTVMRISQRLEDKTRARRYY